MTGEWHAGNGMPFLFLQPFCQRMKAYHDFRVFYNQSVHPELMHLEVRRRRLIRLIYLLIAIALLLGIFGWFLGIFLVNLLIFLVLGVAVHRLITEIRLYFQSFKPRIVTALLDFFDNNINYSHLNYDPAGGIDLDTFLHSGLYKCSADEYHSEDGISGKIREMPFQLCELRVADISAVRSGMDTIFNGVFIVADFLRPEMQGSLFILPDVYRKYHAHSTRAADRAGAKRVDNLLLPEFESIFDTYATTNIRPAQLLDEAFQRTLIAFYRGTGRNISMSVRNSKLYVAMHQNDDLLEPSLWRSNVSYQQIKTYHDDIERIFSMIHALDVLN